MATRALAGINGKREWFSEAPLSTFNASTRTECGLKPLDATSYHSNVVAPTRKNRSVMESVVASTKTRGIDLLVCMPITVRYEVVANAMKKLVTTENNTARVGNCSKMLKGRMCDLEDENYGRMHFLYDGLRCSTEVITGLISDEEMVVFREMFEWPPHVDVDNPTYEDHLSPPQHMETITRVVLRMREKGVGVEDIATFSRALNVKDGITAACLQS